MLFVGLQSCALSAVKFDNGKFSGPLSVNDNSIILTNLLLLIIMISLLSISKNLRRLVNNKYPKNKAVQERLTEEEVEEVISDLKRK